MSEVEIIGWVVKALVVIIGLYKAIGEPMIDNQKAMVKLTLTMENFDKALAKMDENNTESHRRLWDKNKDQDKVIDNHEHRITILEEHRKE